MKSIKIWGQKTLESSNGRANDSKSSNLGSNPSSGTNLDKVGARRLVAHIKRSIWEMSRGFVFAYPDAVTRKHLATSAESMMSNLLARRAIYRYDVRCDESNNPPDLVDKGQIQINVDIQPSPVLQHFSVSTTIGGEMNVLKFLANLEATQHGFAPHKRQKSNRYYIHGIVGLESGFVCDPSHPGSDPFFVVGCMDTHYLLCDGTYRYFKVDVSSLFASTAPVGSSWSSSSSSDHPNTYTTKDKELIDRVIERYVSETPDQN